MTYLSTFADFRRGAFVMPERGDKMASSKFPLYVCDHTKNTECHKTSCAFDPNAKCGVCTNTTKKEFAKLNENGEPIVLYNDMEDIMAEFDTIEHYSSGLLDD